ncbi:MAG TPA: hypothetical protein PLB26_15445 [Rubrivivax sp.]|nr:hypothetical protein [Rubrivivax sp.]
MNLTPATLRHYCTACGDCLLWNLGTTKQGYPCARIDGEVVNVRRYLWELKAGRNIGEGQVIRSTCGNTRCLKHLVARSRGRITAEAYASGRRDRPREYLHRVSSFVSRGLAKLDFDKARQIRERSEEGEAALAAEFGVHKTTIRDVLAGKSWVERPYQSSIFGWTGRIEITEQTALNAPRHRESA